MPSDRPDWMGEDEETDAEEYAEEAGETVARVANTAAICGVSVCVGFVCLGVVAAAWMRSR